MVKLQFTWRPNFIKGFDVAVKNLVEAYICSELFASLDLENGNNIYQKLISDFPLMVGWIERKAFDYKAFRRKHSINSPFLIDSNMGWLSIWVQSENDWNDWIDESEKHDTFYDFKEFVDYLKNETDDWKKELADYPLKELSID